MEWSELTGAAPISVERLRDLLDKASKWRCTGDVLRCTDGNGCECDLSGNPSPWMDLQSAAVNALPALLQQLAELEHELRKAVDECAKHDIAAAGLIGSRDGWMQRAKAAESKLAEREEDCERLRAACSQHTRQAMENGAAYHAAERAREEATGLLREAFDSIMKAAALAGIDPIPEPEPNSIGGRIAAFLAASGGANESR